MEMFEVKHPAMENFSCESHTNREIFGAWFLAEDVFADEQIGRIT
jgi:hypothetical protein